MVFCAFKVETLFHVKHLIKFISSSNHYTLETWPRGINATWITLSLLLDTYLQNTIFAILLAHEHLIWVALPLPPIQCCLQTVKAPIRKEFGQIVLSNIEWGKGGVWPTTYDSDCLYMIIWGHEIMQSGQPWKNSSFRGKRGVATAWQVFLDGGFLSSAQKET